MTTLSQQVGVELLKPGEVAEVDGGVLALRADADSGLLNLVA